MTLAQRYNEKARLIMPHMGSRLIVDDAIDSTGHIDEVVFRRGEYLGGMAAVLLELVARDV